ncbi:hypothetical protein [Floridanema aerugineum]|uniref:Uncharacterized protein n=1 Tax=Floridaenema aerugineum BLCC-F46 TaxID=3153654 RepID=A0ABV4X6B2_9CYAN
MALNFQENQLARLNKYIEAKHWGTEQQTNASFSSWQLKRCDYLIDCFVGIAKSIAPYNQNYTERLNSSKVGNSHLIVLFSPKISSTNLVLPFDRFFGMED